MAGMLYQEIEDAVMNNMPQVLGVEAFLTVAELADYRKETGKDPTLELPIKIMKKFITTGTALSRRKGGERRLR
jgi:hypothetical protein